MTSVTLRILDHACREVVALTLELILIGVLLIGVGVGWQLWRKRRRRRFHLQPFEPYNDPKPSERRGRPSRKHQAELLRLMGGDRAGAERLLELERRKNPGQDEDWYWDKVIYDLKRDRRA